MKLMIALKNPHNFKLTSTVNKYDEAFNIIPNNRLIVFYQNKQTDKQYNILKQYWEYKMQHYTFWASVRYSQSVSPV